jgi:zinc protease
VGFDVGEDAFALHGSTTPDDLLLQLELMAACTQDPGWRAEALEQVRKNLPPQFEALAHRPDGPVQFSFLGRLHSGDPRFGLPPLERLLAVTREEMRDWLDPQLKSAPIELTIVGQVDVEAVVAAVARTFGALPARSPPQDVSSRLAVKVATGLHDSATVQTEVPQALLVIKLPTTDGRDALVRRQLNLLGDVASDRLRVEVREKLGVAYSPSARNEPSEVYPGVGFVAMYANAEPARAQDVLDACLAVAGALARDGVTAEELERARTPILARLRDQMRNNNFWLSVLDDSQARAGALDEIRHVESDYKSVTTEMLSDMAHRWFAPERASWIVVKPAAVPAPADASAGG